MSPAVVINFLRKTFSVLLIPLLLGTLVSPIVGIRSIILDQSPAKGYNGVYGTDLAFEVNGFTIQDREPDHQSRFYSKDKFIRVSENTAHYTIQVKARSLFYCLAFLLNIMVSGVYIGIFWNFMQLFKRTTLQNPFNRKVVKQLKILALFFIVLDVLKLVQSVVYGIFLSKSFLYTFVESDVIYSLGKNLMTGVIIWIIAVIFQRGIDLQEENALTV
jgi:hypothetical protein